MLFIILIVVVFVWLYHIEKEKYLFNISSIGQDIKNIKISNVKIASVSEIGISKTLSLVFYADDIWENLPLSQHFKNKYSHSKDIINNINKYEKTFAVGVDGDYIIPNVMILYADKKNLINSDLVSTRFYFKYILNDKNELDDIELIRQVDVDSTTGKRLDGKTEIMSFPYIPYYMALFTDHRLNDEEEFKVLPIADNCTVINKPNVETWTKPKIILNEFVDKEDKIFDEVFLKIEYSEGVKEWRIKYSIDKNMQFDNIEYIDVES